MNGTTRMDSPSHVTWEDMAELVESGGIAELPQESALTAIYDALDRPTLNGEPVEPGAFDRTVAEVRLLSDYADATAVRFASAGLDFVDSARAPAESEVAQALSRASGVPQDAYWMAREFADGGDRSALIGMYSRFLDSL